MTIEDSIKTKDPAETISFGFDWSELLTQSGEVILSHTLTTSASGLTLTNDYHTSASVIFLASGGQASKRYPVVCTISTSGSQIIERTMKIDVKNL